MMKKQFVIVGIFFSSIILLFIVRLFSLQVLENASYTAQVAQIASRKNTVQGLRGRILDNKNTLLAYNVSTYQINIVPSEFPIKNREQQVTALASLLHISEEIIYEVLRKKNATTPAVLLDNIRYEDAIAYIEHISEFPGVYWDRTIQRYYPLGDFMAHVVGYTGAISLAELKLLNHKGYKNFDVIGKAGVEKQYENELRGTTGVISRKVNVFGKKIGNTERVLQSANPGYDVVLTLDANIQKIVEKAMGDRVGAAVVMRPTGEILAMVSYPRFNPNVLSFSLDQKLSDNIQTNKNSPFLNRVIQASASPASTFKIIMLTAFYQEFPDDWNYKVYDRGYLDVGNRRFYSWFRSGRGWIDSTLALGDSTNTYFYTIGIEKLGPQKISDYATLFGLGASTGIDLPWEVMGIVPSPTWKEQRYNESWQDGDTANLSIGQGYTAVTPLQLANMVAAVVNDGVVYTPHVLQEIRDQSTGKVIRRFEPKVLRTIGMVDKKVFAKTRKNMRYVVTDGTAKVVITTDRVKVAAKTGTGQVLDNVETKKYNSWFVSYAPYDAPKKDQLILVTWVDASNKWEWWAPKAANIIFYAIFSNQSYIDTINELKRRGTWYL